MVADHQYHQTVRQQSQPLFRSVGVMVLDIHPQLQDGQLIPAPSLSFSLSLSG